MSVIDRRWRDHLYEMDYLKDGIGLRAMAQRDPLIEYQREGYALFQTMMGQIREDTVGFLFNLEVEVSGGKGTAQVTAKGLNAPQTPQNLSYTAPSADGDVEVRNQRGQLQQTATDRARAAAPAAGPAFGRPAAGQQGRPAPRTGQGGQRPATGGQTGAFGQRTEGGAATPPVNRAQRRAQDKKKP